MDTKNDNMDEEIAAQEVQEQQAEEPSSEGQQDRGLEIKRLKTQLEKQKLAMDKAAKEAAEYKRQLRSKKSMEEQEADAAKERQQAMEEELSQLRRESAVGNISKRIMGFIEDEQCADMVAGGLYGAEDVDTAIDAIQKAWSAKEKRLRLEYSKLPAPAAGDGAPSVTKDELKKMNYRERVEFAHKFPDAYKNLTK